MKILLLRKKRMNERKEEREKSLFYVHNIIASNITLSNLLEIFEYIMCIVYIYIYSRTSAFDL